MVRQAVISGGVSYHHGLIQPGEILHDFEVIPLGESVSVDLNRYDLIVVPRSVDGEVLRARRYQFARFLDRGGVLIAFGELWANWFPGCRWEAECHEDILEPVIARDHPIIAGFSARDLHWHPSTERWCCHGHLSAPPGAEVLVRNQRGDAWLYVDQMTTNGLIIASSNLDPDTHTYHRSPVAGAFFAQLLAWARAEAELLAHSRQQTRPKIAGLYSGVHFQRAFYEDAEFASRFAILRVWELAATNLHDYAALWIPRESNQDVLLQQRDKLSRYLAEGGVIICFDEVNQPWLPFGSWKLRPVDLNGIRVADHPVVAHLTPEQVRWHSHGAYDAYDNADILIDDGLGEIMLFLDERSTPGKLLAGTLDPDCHAGYGTETTRPLLRAILGWVEEVSHVQARPSPAKALSNSLRR